MGLMPHTIFQVMIIASKTSISQDFISMSSTGQAKPYHAQDQPDANEHSELCQESYNALLSCSEMLRRLCHLVEHMSSAGVRQFIFFLHS